MKKTILYVLIFSGIFTAYKLNKKSKKADNTAVVSNCKGNGSYKSGYSSGRTSSMLGGTSSCETYVSTYNDELGRNVIVADDCFCEGFKDGYNSK